MGFKYQPILSLKKILRSCTRFDKKIIFSLVLQVPLAGPIQEHLWALQYVVQVQEFYVYQLSLEVFMADVV